MEGNDLDICKYICNSFGKEQLDIKTVSPLTLAYIGDCIYDLYIRTIIVEAGNAPVNKLHKRVSDLVKAQTQMELIKSIEDILTDEERQVFKRGRNAKSYTSAKNASKSDYRNATGFEALLGYLYMIGNIERISFLIKEGLVKLEKM